ncbi:MAG: O-antigen ligase family protein [Rhizobiaceae bacterium]|nr:O-antigen ligase family protein [Rhizobiaceae bacterium]
MLTVAAAPLPDFAPVRADPLANSLLARWSIGLIAFLGAFVINEPAPYELLLLVIMVLFLMFGMRLSGLALYLGILMIVFNIGGMLSMFTMPDYKEIPLYLAVSLFLGLSSVFWAAAIENNMGRLRVLMRGYVVGAAITSVLGIAGYFGAFPGAELFTLYDRAKGAFQDPNVFGPFLILPALYLTYGLLYRSVTLAPVRMAFLLIILLGLFLSFSRGAWGGLAIAGVIFYATLLMTEQSEQMRAKLILAGVLGIAALAGALIVALQFDAVYDMFEQRARVVQEYDGAQLGRFARHAIGFQWALENPLGIGPLEFGQILGEDTHNIWVKALMAYGWLGFFAYLTLTACTLVGGARLIGRIRPWQPYLLCIYATYVGHIVLAWVIDVDHWRHVYLLIGLIWGCMALEVNHQRKAAAGAAIPANGMLANAA